MNVYLLKFITVLHYLFILFIVLTPFLTNSNYILTLHCYIIPFILLHWALNNNVCILTLIERKIRKELYGDKYKEVSCATCRLIDPVFNFKNNYINFEKSLYVVCIVLWSCSFYKLLKKHKNGDILTFRQLFKL